MKLLDCSNNNLACNYFTELENNNNIIILQSGNLFLMDEVLCKDHYSNLKNKLANINHYSLANLSLSYIPTFYSISFFDKLKINHSLLINLNTLNLSYNGLYCDIFFSFIEKNKECLNLRTLNLIGNEFDDTFFEKYGEVVDFAMICRNDGKKPVSLTTLEGIRTPYLGLALD